MFMLLRNVCEFQQMFRSNFLFVFLKRVEFKKIIIWKIVHVAKYIWHFIVICFLKSSKKSFESDVALDSVGGNLPPRTPMGTEPLSGSAGGGGRAKSGP